jgi:hypothetical protein
MARMYSAAQPLRVWLGELDRLAQEGFRVIGGKLLFGKILVELHPSDFNLLCKRNYVTMRRV